MELFQAVGSQPHKMTASGSVAHFNTDMAGQLTLVGSGNITVSGANLIDDTIRSAGRTTVYIGAVDGSYNLYLKAGVYRFSAEMLNNADYSLYIRPSSGSTTVIWSAGNHTTTALVTLTQSGLYRINFYMANGLTASDIGNCWLTYGTDAIGYEPYKGETLPAESPRKSLIGTNNVWSDVGNIEVTYWTHK